MAPRPAPHLHRGPQALPKPLSESRPVAALLQEMGAPYLITLPAMYTDLYTGELTEPAELTDDQWQQLGNGHTELGRILGEESGVRQMFHPHADAHVDGNTSIDRFLQLTDPTHVSLCLDTGHVAYVGGDNHAIVADHPDRIGYIHLKSVDPTVVAGSGRRISFADAVQLGAMVEPDAGEPDMPRLLAELNALDVPLWAIVEHDMYPAPAGPRSPSAPAPAATTPATACADRVSRQPLKRTFRPAGKSSKRADLAAWGVRFAPAGSKRTGGCGRGLVRGFGPERLLVGSPTGVPIHHQGDAGGYLARQTPGSPTSGSETTTWASSGKWASRVVDEKLPYRNG